jgi:SAM-dependent methyltransferase
VSEIRSQLSLFEGALESARIFNWVAAECAATSGLFDVVANDTPLQELVANFRVHESKADGFRAYLGVLVDLDLLERRKVRDDEVYCARSGNVEAGRGAGGGLRRYAPRLELLSPWYGEGHADLIRSSNIELLGEDLAFYRSPTEKIRFDRTFLSAWKTNLTNPLYEFGRALAVRELCARGRRFLDLASGLGYGAERLAQFAEGCEVVCVDNSPDMLAQSRLLVYPDATIRFIMHDLNDGLPPFPPNSFDGVLFNGSFHFVEDKRTMLEQIRRVLRPGGLLVLGHVFCRSGFADEAMHDLYFSLVENPSWILTFDGLRDLAAETGFVEVDRWHRGSHSFLLVERPLDPADRVRVRE